MKKQECLSNILRLNSFMENGLNCVTVQTLHNAITKIYKTEKCKLYYSYGLMGAMYLHATKKGLAGRDICGNYVYFSLSSKYTFPLCCFTQLENNSSEIMKKRSERKNRFINYICNVTLEKNGKTYNRKMLNNSCVNVCFSRLGFLCKKIEKVEAV